MISDINILCVHLKYDYPIIIKNVPPHIINEIIDFDQFGQTT